MIITPEEDEAIEGGRDPARPWTNGFLNYAMEELETREKSCLSGFGFGICGGKTERSESFARASVSSQVGEKWAHECDDNREVGGNAAQGGLLASGLR